MITFPVASKRVLKRAPNRVPKRQLAKLNVLTIVVYKDHSSGLSIELGKYRPDGPSTVSDTGQVG